MATRKSEPALDATPVLDALNAAVKKATHLTDLDEPAVEAARALARKIDLVDLYFDELTKAQEEKPPSHRRPPSQDNVSIPTFLKFCESLGLTPAGRRGLVDPPKPPEKKTGLASVSNIPRPA